MRFNIGTPRASVQKAGGNLLSIAIWLAAVSGGALTCGCAADNAIGVFQSQSDVGETGLPGKSEYDAASGRYRLTGSGENIWYHRDAFHFVWKRVSGDLELITQMEWEGAGHEHRKGGWMIRQDLDYDSAYVDAVIHGSGMAAMQFRKLKDGPTDESQAGIAHPAWIKLARQGSLYSMFVRQDGQPWEPVSTISANLIDPVYVGLVVCSHDNAQTASAVFKNTTLAVKGVVSEEDRMLESNLEIFDIQTGRRKTIFSSTALHFEAPNWSRDGKTILFNGGGRLYTISADGGLPNLLDTGFADRCNNDHGYSPDGRQIALSHQENDISRIYILPAEGGAPRLATEQGPSYWHGWSPDGKTLVYCGKRHGQFDIYTIPVEGGKETRLTEAAGYNDGPEYSPDGKTIYFNSDREGPMLLWKMDADGGNQTPITFSDQYNDWFAHPSPDGRQIVFLSYDKTVQGHPANREVALRLMHGLDDEPRTLTRLFGGQGTLNVHSWAPDSRRFAFVSYRLVEKQKP
jgi:Tol biopolymer transport system component